MPPNCTITQLAVLESTTSSWSYLFQFLYCVFCLAACYLTYICNEDFHYSESVLTPNFKFLCILRLCFMTIFSIVFISCQILILVGQVLTTGCDRMWTMNICASFRFFLFWSVNFFQLFYVAILLTIILEPIWTSTSPRFPYIKRIRYIVSFLPLIFVVPFIILDLLSGESMFNCASFETMGTITLTAYFSISLTIYLSTLIGYISWMVVLHRKQKSELAIKEKETIQETVKVLLVLLQMLLLDMFSTLALAIYLLLDISFPIFYPVPLCLFLNTMILLINPRRYDILKGAIWTPRELERGCRVLYKRELERRRHLRNF